MVLDVGLPAAGLEENEETALPLKLYRYLLGGASLQAAPGGQAIEGGFPETRRKINEWDDTQIDMIPAGITGRSFLIGKGACQ